MATGECSICNRFRSLLHLQEPSPTKTTAATTATTSTPPRATTTTMAGDKTTVHSLDQPEKLNDLLKKDRQDDCLPCRLIGGTAFLGLAAYSYASGMSQLNTERAAALARKSMFGLRSRRLGITGISLGLAWMGLYRLFK